MADEDIRWHQRFSNFKKAFAQLEKAVQMNEQSEIEREGMIQRFEYTYELAWNTLKDFLLNQGFLEIKGPRDTIRQGFKSGLIEDGGLWMDMLDNRNLTAHTYHEETALKVADKIKNIYFGLFYKLLIRLEKEEFA